MHQCGEKFTNYLEANLNRDVDCKEIFQRFTIEILGTLGCGVDPHVLENGKNRFYEEAMILSGATNPSILVALRFAVSFFLPDLSYKLDMSIFEPNNLNFFIQVIQKSIEQRKNNNMRRNDFIDLLRDSIEELETEKKEKICSEEEFQDYVVANGMMLFFVGNDTSSGALALALHFLAWNPEAQEKLYNEIQVFFTVKHFLMLIFQ